MHRLATGYVQQVRTACAVTSLLLAACCGYGGGGGASLETGWTPERSAIDREIVRDIDGGRYGEALELIEGLISSGVTDSRLLGQKAHVLAEMGRYGESIPLFEEAIIKDYENCENHLNFAVMLMRTGKTGRAMTEFTVAKRFCGRENMSVISRNLAVASIKMGDEEGARENVLEGLSYDPGDPYLRGLKAMLIAGTSPAQAESLFVSLERSGEAAHEFLYQYGLLLLRTGRPARSADVLGRAAALQPADIDTRIALAEALNRSGGAGKAERLLRELLAEAGGDSIRGARKPAGGDSRASGSQPAGGEHRAEGGRLVQIRIQLAGVLSELGRFQEAIEMYGTLDPTAEILDRIAMCYHGMGRFDEALAWERRALEKRPEWTTAMVNLAVILAARGDLEEAMSVLERVVAVEPGNNEANRNIELLREAMRGGHPSPEYPGKK